MDVILLVLRLVVAGAVAALVVAPAWWLAGRIQAGGARAGGSANPFFRLLVAIGLGLVGYLSVVNLVGKLTGDSHVGVIACLVASAAATVLVGFRSRHELSLVPLRASWRRWLGPVALAVVLAAPQWLLGVSTNFWDEAASSAIQLTGSNQFADGLFPPRHNAFPEVSVKYHYGFMILSGTVQWLTGLSANVSVDLVSTALWLLSFLFAYFWFRDLGLGRFVAGTAGFALLLGGSLAWAYLPRIEVYGTSAYEKVPAASELLHRHDPAKGWPLNVLATGRAPSLNLRNSDGSLSNLPWDVAAQFQQHAVALGFFVTLLGLYLLVTWQSRKTLDAVLLAANVATFGVLFLCHAVFGGVGAITAGTCLLLDWLLRPSLQRLLRGALLTAGVGALALLHGGMLSRGAEYGAGGLMTLRKSFGYADGGLSGFLNWNVAGFGVPLFLALVAWTFHLPRRVRRDPAFSPQRRVVVALTVMTLFSYLVPQLAFYVSEGNDVEQYTEISKFFFCTRYGLALLSAFGVACLRRFLPWPVFLPAFAAMAVVPLAFCHASVHDAAGKWIGFYKSPYGFFGRSIEVQAGETLRALTKTNRDVYFDASHDERTHGYLGELLIYGGSVFTLSPSRFERNGVSFRLAEDVVARRHVQMSRMARLVPGAAEDAACTWYYARPLEDMAFAPISVRARLDKLIGEGTFVPKFVGASRVLYSIERPTVDLDRDIELYWRPRVVMQGRGVGHAVGETDLLFYDHANARLLAGADVLELPAWLRGELAHVLVDSFLGDGRRDVLVGRMLDCDYRLGQRFTEVIEQNPWAWTYRESAGGGWQPEYHRWLWDEDVVLVTAIDGSGSAGHVAYTPKTGAWRAAPGFALAGPSMAKSELPVPLGGRFLRGSEADLALWSLKTGMLTIRSLTTGETFSFKWGVRAGDVQVPGDYDGDGVDEIAVWQRTNATWYWRDAPDGPIDQATFGTGTCVPIPFDYDGDGRLDLAYWEPRERKIFVSFSQGRSVDLTLDVPPGTIPAFVAFY